MVVMIVSMIIVRHDFYAPCLMFCVSLLPTLLCITRLVLYHSPSALLLSTPVTHCVSVSFVMSMSVVD